jgi:hypothetical protein
MSRWPLLNAAAFQPGEVQPKISKLLAASHWWNFNALVALLRPDRGISWVGAQAVFAPHDPPNYLNDDEYKQGARSNRSHDQPG